MDNNWNLSGLLIEGISGTGKTALLESLVRSKRFVEKSYLSSIVLSEHQTQRVLEKKSREEGLDVSDNLRLLDNHTSYLENVNRPLEEMDWCRNNQINMRIPYILERFHLTHVYQYEHMNWHDVSAIDSHLKKLNCKLCLLITGPEELGKRLFTGRDAQWMNYIQRFGRTNNEILEHFIQQQENLIGLSEVSNLETIIIDTGVTDFKATLKETLDFWGAI